MLPVRSLLIFLVLLGAVWLIEAEIQEPCKSKLLTLQSCLPYVTGKASSPTSDCCGALKTIRAGDPVCLCELISDGGSSYVSGLNITTLLALPVICSVDANASKCPELLNGAPPPKSSSSQTMVVASTTWILLVSLFV
ncbi:protein YLS3 [Selaginella moellendorffii]|nr:protein YLS3 [Selaginella moellendorffii]|eukprot:XP_002967359.2 protein YLS3 [Selaginella moellendorffii]